MPSVPHSSTNSKKWRYFPIFFGILNFLKKVVDNHPCFMYNNTCVETRQTNKCLIGVWLSLARAPDLGSGGRRFESCHPDLKRRNYPSLFVSIPFFGLLCYVQIVSCNLLLLISSARLQKVQFLCSIVDCFLDENLAKKGL